MACFREGPFFPDFRGKSPKLKTPRFSTSPAYTFTVLKARFASFGAFGLFGLVLPHPSGRARIRQIRVLVFFLAPAFVLLMQNAHFGSFRPLGPFGANLVSFSFSGRPQRLRSLSSARQAARIGMENASARSMALMPAFVADGHTASNTPDLFRPPQLSGAGPG